MRTKYLLMTVAASIFLGSTLTIGQPLLAQESEGTNSTTPEHSSTPPPAPAPTSKPPTETEHTTPEHSPNTGPTANSEQKHELDDSKKQICEKKQDGMVNRMQQIIIHANGHMDKFAKITQRIEDFAAKTGKKPANYDALVADVSAKKASAAAAIAAIATDKQNFSCTSSDPKGTISAFKNSLKTVIAALKDYRMAIKNLIAGVKSAQGTTGGNQ